MAGVLASHLLHESVDHMHEAWAAHAAAASKATTTTMGTMTTMWTMTSVRTMTMTTTTASASSESVSAAFLTSAGSLISGLSCPLLSFLLGFRSILGKHVDEDIGSTTVLSNLEHWVLVWKAIFAELAQVKVLADGALVTDALDWFDSAAVAGDVEVDDLGLWVIVEFIIFVLWKGAAEVLALEELTEDLFALGLKLIVDEVLESFAWDALLATLLASLHSFGWFLVFTT